MLKIAVLAPMPSANVAIAVTENDGRARSERAEVLELAVEVFHSMGLDGLRDEGVGGCLSSG